MFGYERRPGAAHETKGMDLLWAATDGLDGTYQAAREVKRAYLQVFRGKRHEEDRDLVHAVVQIADLWAFETGRLP